MHKEKYPYSTGRLREPIERARCAGSRLRKEQEKLWLAKNKSMQGTASGCMTV